MIAMIMSVFDLLLSHLVPFWFERMERPNEARKADNVDGVTLGYLRGRVREAHERYRRARGSDQAVA